MEANGRSVGTPTRIGIVGSGFVSRGLAFAFAGCEDLDVTGVLTRHATPPRRDYPFPHLLTESLEELIESADVIVVSSGDPVYTTRVIHVIVEAGLPVVTMDSEFHITAGSWFVNRGYVTEAEGDQPGTLAALRSNAMEMGFRPLVYGNVKGFLNHTPTKEEMRHWAHRQGISLRQVTSFTDGTKLQIEQALVANGFGAGIAKRGLIGLRCDDIHFAGEELAAVAADKGEPIADYVRSAHLPAGVFVVCSHDDEQQPFLRYLKLGEGPYYTLMHNFHLCHLEVAKTVRQVVNGAPPLLNNSETPRVSVAAVAKKRLEIGDRIEKGIGSFEVRGEALEIEQNPGHIPIGLVAEGIIKRRVEPGQVLAFDDIEIPESKALSCWKDILERTRVRSLVDGTLPALSAGILHFATEAFTLLAIECCDRLISTQELLRHGQTVLFG